MVATLVKPPEGTVPAVAVRGVFKRYGPFAAVDGVDLDIAPGELFGLIGHNGAGKSTLFKMMLGLLSPSAGQIEIEGVQVQGAHFRSVRQRIGYLPENVVLYDNLTGQETLAFFAKLKSCPVSDCSRVLEVVGLAQAGQKRVREYSKGMRQRLGFAQALLGQPRILFLDEPTTGLDPEAIREFYDTLKLLRDQGVTVVLTSHILAEIQTRVDRLAVMKAGRIQAMGTVAHLREALDLPVQIVLTSRSAQEAAALGERLAPLALTPLADGRLALYCAQAEKLRVLGLLAGCESMLNDIQIIEPSLEDVFLSMKGPRA